MIALFAAGVVIASTFTILVSHRTRNLALLRCVGATSGQIRRSVLSEATILAVLLDPATSRGVSAVALR